MCQDYHADSYGEYSNPRQNTGGRDLHGIETGEGSETAEEMRHERERRPDDDSEEDDPAADPNNHQIW